MRLIVASAMSRIHIRQRCVYVLSLRCISLMKNHFIIVSIKEDVRYANIFLMFNQSGIERAKSVNAMRCRYTVINTISLKNVEKSFLYFSLIHSVGNVESVCV